ncbi:hypothetical protein J6X90_01205 [Candidatus Saccharibacteria bacterium]|nr:hypothetical protein [Candidatus Saccharibacteria bacterium]
MVYRRKINNYVRFLNYGGIFALSMFVAATAVYFYSPVVDSHADDTNGSTGTAVLSMSLSDTELGLVITPTESGVFDSNAMTVTVNTDSTGGYKLTFSSDGDTADMVAAGSDMVIASDFNGTVTSATMPANKWGYSIDNTNFLKIPVLSSEATIRDLDHAPSTTEQTSTITIGMKIDSSLKSGIYKRDVIFSALAHEPKDTRTIFDITEMQEMTSAICKNTTTPLASATQFDNSGSHIGDKNYVPRTLLDDMRNGKMYLISKLADGNCWMSQNLALELREGVPVEASKLDGTAVDITPTTSTQASAPAAQTGAPPSWGTNDAEWHSMKPHEDVAYLRGGATPSSAATGDDISYAWEENGYYYNWFAATAGSSSSTSDNIIPTLSLCPKGWRLPLEAGSKGYTNLLTTYGLTDVSDSTLITAAPLNFVLAGNVNYATGEIDNVGKDGYYRTMPGARAFSITPIMTSPNAAALYREYYGYSIRCMAI